MLCVSCTIKGVACGTRTGKTELIKYYLLISDNKNLINFIDLLYIHLISVWFFCYFIKFCIYEKRKKLIHFFYVIYVHRDVIMVFFLSLIICREPSKYCQHNVKDPRGTKKFEYHCFVIYLIEIIVLSEAYRHYARARVFALFPFKSVAVLRT